MKKIFIILLFGVFFFNLVSSDIVSVNSMGNNESVMTSNYQIEGFFFGENLISTITNPPQQQMGYITEYTSSQFFNYTNLTIDLINFTLISDEIEDNSNNFFIVKMLNKNNNLTDITSLDIVFINSNISTTIKRLSLGEYKIFFTLNDFKKSNNILNFRIKATQLNKSVENYYLLPVQSNSGILNHIEQWFENSYDRLVIIIDGNWLLLVIILIILDIYAIIFIMIKKQSNLLSIFLFTVLSLLIGIIIFWGFQNTMKDTYNRILMVLKDNIFLLIIVITIASMLLVLLLSLKKRENNNIYK